ncbi:hypothetical protein [Verrucomicrobium spinosum]|uniref:hypothetical protein n=1 Tax=Verrucomicrobium spinosum TaxID=2736 RepID=UPI0001744B1E|nr:hypothetical protein [Verrucomicrobium spinosum]
MTVSTTDKSLLTADNCTVNFITLAGGRDAASWLSRAFPETPVISRARTHPRDCPRFQTALPFVLERQRDCCNDPHGDAVRSLLANQERRLPVPRI